jgi:hypothetical protein
MNTLSRLETGAVDFVARTVPWFSPLPTAYLTAQATVRHLGWPGGMGVVAGAIIEGLGLASVATALELREYNATRRKSDPKAPFGLTVALAGVYLASVTALTVVLDTAPRLATYAPLIFPLMSLTGATLLAIRADHRQRLAAIEADKLDRSARRSVKRSARQSITGQVSGQRGGRAAGRTGQMTGQRGGRAAGRTGQMTGQRDGQVVTQTGQMTGQRDGQVVTQTGRVTGQQSVQVTGQTGQVSGQRMTDSNVDSPVSSGHLTHANRVRQYSREQALNGLLTFLAERPNASYSEMGAAVNRSKSWAVGAVKELEAEGRLRRNGGGFEVRAG